jgi:hypothetical protein
MSKLKQSAKSKKITDKFFSIQKTNSVPIIREGMLSFEFNGQLIVDPTVDETGRNPVDGSSYYSITKKEVNKMVEVNHKKVFNMWK